MFERSPSQRIDPNVDRVDVELDHEKSPRSLPIALRRVGF
jgi:hypothetical protein